MKDYDPNMEWCVQVVRITYQQWDYVGEFDIPIRGNCQGMSILSAAIGTHADMLFDEQSGYPTIVLKRPAADGDGEDTLECDAADRDLEQMCVGLRIISQTLLDDKVNP